MKKLSLFLVLGLLVSSLAVAASFEVSPNVGFRQIKDGKPATTFGVDTVVSDITGGLQLIGGLERFNADVDEKSESFQLDVWKSELAAGYKFEAGKLSLTPYAGLDLYFVDADNSVKADEELGYTVGGKVEYAVAKNVSLVGKLGYSWGSIGVGLPDGKDEVSVDGMNGTVGVSIKF